MKSQLHIITAAAILLTACNRAPTVSGSQAALTCSTSSAFNPSDEATYDPGSDVYVSKIENPLLEGQIDFCGLDKEELTPSEPWYSAEVGYFYDGRVITSDLAPVFPVNDWLAYLSLVPTEDDMADFISPTIWLPPDHSVVTLSLMSRRLPDGQPVDTYATIRMQLDPYIIVVPVFLHVFADASDDVSNYIPAVVDERWVRNWFDPSPAVELGASLVYDPGTGTNGTYWTQGTLNDQDVIIDGIWRQCNIQLRMVSYEHIPQSDSLEKNMYSSEEAALYGSNVCGALASSSRIRNATLAHNAPVGLNVYLGGSFEDVSYGDTYAVTCGASRPCNDHADPKEDDLPPFFGPFNA